MKKKKKHRLIKWMIFILVLLFAAGKGITFVKTNSAKAVDVYPVKDIKVDGIMGDVSLSGMITDHTSQEIVKDEDKSVKEIFVKNGQKVKKGDPLLSYDTTLKELELKDAQIQLQLEEENIKRIKKQINNPKKYYTENFVTMPDTLQENNNDEDTSVESESELETMEQTLETQEKKKGEGETESAQDPEEPQGTADAVKVTKEDIAEYVKNKRMELKQAELSLEKKKLQVSRLEKEAEESIKNSYLDGVVTISDDNNDEIVLTVESTEGLYIEGAMNEYLVSKVQTGDLLTGEDYYTGAMFEASIRSISDTPKTDGGMYDYSGSENMSYYGFTAEIQGDIEAESGDDCSLKFAEKEDENGINIEKMFVLQENNGSYVYKENNKGQLEKTKIQVGAIIDGYYVKVLDGLTESDYVAFPYGESVMDGAKTNQTDIDSLYQ